MGIIAIAFSFGLLDFIFKVSDTSNNGFYDMYDDILFFENYYLLVVVLLVL